MKLINLSSGSKGNCYILDAEKGALVIEAGIPFLEVKKAIGFNVSKVSALLVSHTHKDHSKYTAEYERAGIAVFKPYEADEEYQKKAYGRFTVTSFPLVHDVPCRGFLIGHPDIGRLLYASDTEYIKYRFTGLNHMLIECNHETELVSDEAHNFEHSLTGHMSLETCKGFVAANSNANLKNVVLCHMSDKNINEERALAEVSGITKANVFSAHTHREVDLRLVPF